MSKKKHTFDLRDYLNSPEVNDYVGRVQAQEDERRRQADAQAPRKPTESAPVDRTWREAAHDTGLAAVQGGAKNLVGGAAWLANQAGIGDGATARDMVAFAQDIEENQKSARMRAANQAVDKADGVIDTAAALIDNPIAILDMGAQNSLMAVPGMGAASLAGRGAMAMGKGLVAQRMAATAAGIGAESLTSGTAAGNEVFQVVQAISTDDLRKHSARFRFLEKEIGADKAKAQLADESSQAAAMLASAGTAVGGAVAGKIAGRFGLESGYATAAVGREALTPAGFAKNMARESMEEAIQSPLEDAGQGVGKKQADERVNPLDGMGKSALLGAVGSFGQTGATSAMQGARNGVSLREAAPVTDVDATAQPVQPQPSPAEYDPIAPNQQALLRRMGIEADPVAEAAVASVESSLGKGDPTAGLVASVMRGDALQPIHDLAAVRANTILPVGSNEGGLYEPQWLPDAAQGESANGLPMPKHGFDSQEKLLGNVRLDARDADLMRAKDEAFARYEQEQQQAAARKPQDLERVHQDSIVPATIDRADASNQLNQALANASGEGVAAPNAMQLALQKASAQQSQTQEPPLATEGRDGARDEKAQKPQSFIPSHGGKSVVSENAAAGNDVAANQIPSQHVPAHASIAQEPADSAPALSMQQNERGQWLIKGDMAQHAQAIREALPGTKLVVSQQKGQALVQMPADKDTASQGKAIRKALDHLVMSGEQLAQRDSQRQAASERVKARNQQAQQIDPAQDDILQAVAKLGGIDTDQAMSEWWRGQPETIGHYNGEVPGNLRRQGVFAFKRGGQPIDTVIRRLEGEGYLPEGATPNDLLDAIEQRRLHPAGMEERARREFEARQQEEAPGEFQQAYDDGRFADEFTASELEEDGFFDLNRKQREAAEAAAEAAKSAELDKLIDNAQVIASQSGPVTEEELDAIFGPQSRNTTTESPQADRGAATERTTAGTGGGAQATETAQTEDGFGLASYTESDLRRQGQEAEQQQREVERQRAAADKARQDEETRKEIRRRSEAAADTFTLGGNAEDNLTGQGGLFDAPAQREKQAEMPRRVFKSVAGVGDIVASKERYSEKYGVSWASTDIASAETMESAEAIAKAVAESGADNIRDMRDVAAKHQNGLTDSETESSSAQNTADSTDNTAETPQNAASKAEIVAAIDALIATGERRRDAGEPPRMSREGLAYPPPAGDGDAMSAMNWLGDAERQQLHDLKQSLPSAASEREAAQARIKQKLERRKPSLNGGAIDSNEPKADYTDHYETDLFGNPLPNAGRKTRATKPAPSGVRRNVHAASALPGDTAAPDGEYRVRTIVGSESQRTLGARRIASLDDLAAATSYLYRSAVERFDAIVTDASGKPLAVIGAFKGAIDQASVYPATLVGEAVRIPGAAQIWFSHNHPSGTAKLSNADQTLYHRLADVFDGSGITPMGLIAVANRQYASMEDGYLPIPQSSESMPVPVVERELSATDVDMPAITSPQSAKDLASSLYKGSDYQPGMMLLNTQNQLAAWVPLPATAMGALRHSGGLNAIYRAISESNAGAVILVHGGELSERIGSVTLGQNIAAAVAKLDVRPLDIIDIRKPRSAAETGELIQSGPVYSKANDYTSTQGMSAKELQAIIAKALPAHLRERVKVAQSRSNNAQQSARSEDRDLIEAEYDPETGQLTLYADAIQTPERALFVLSHELTHYGLDAKYGSGLSSILLEARNNPTIAKLAAEIAVDRGMTVNSVRQDIADALGVPVARVARSVAVHRLQVETANEALAELNAAIERNDFAYLQDRYGVAVPKMMRNDLRGRLSRLAASVKAWLAKLTGKQASDYSDKQVWDLLAGVRETVRGGGNVAETMSGRSGQNGGKGNILRSTAPKQPASAGFSLPDETLADTAQREVQDNMNRWKQVLENVREQGGQVDEQNDVYGAEERFHGRAATRIEDFARDEVEPLMQRLADSGRSLQEVEQYLLAQHAEEANARIREIDDSRDTAFGMEDDEAQSIMAKFAAMPDATEFKRLANDFRRISEGTLSLYVKAGIVAPEAAHAMRLAYQFYVPVKGGDEDQAARQGTGKGLSVNGKQKRRMGHDMRDEHVLENMLRDRQRAIVLAEKNNVGTYLLDLIERNPDPKLWTVNVLPKQKVLRDQVSYVVELNGQMLDAFNSLEAARVFIRAEAARTGSKPGAFAVSKSSDPYVTMMAKPTLQDHEVQVYVQGRAVRIQLHDPILAGQYRRMGTEQMGRIIEAGKALNRWLSKVYTGYNPEFFVKNVVRDLFAGTINLTADQGAKVTAKALWHWPKAGAAMFHFALNGKAPAGEYGKALQRYRAAGGSTGAAYMGDLERQADTLQTLYENYSGAMAALQEGKPGKAAKIATRKLLGGLAHWFEVWNQAGENAFRLATFMAMQESGKTVAESASMAKNVTVNFNRKGELTPQLGGLYLFFNPGVQGTARLWQSLAGKDTKHKKQAWALVGSMAGAALALAMMNRGDDEDEWEAIPDSVKDRNLIIPLGNKRKLTIPLPYGYSFFVSLANRLDAVMHGESAEKASIRLASSLFENFSPVGNPIGDDPKGENLISMVPTALKMVLQPAFNITDFGGPMRPEYNASQPDNEKMWRGTRGSLYDKAAQGIASLHGSPYENNWNDVSPETLKYWVKTLTGGTGAFMADSASLLNVLASGSTPDVSEVPFVRSAVRESTVKDVRARFNELGKEAKGHVDAWKRAVDAGDDKAAGKYEQESELMALGEMLSGYKEQASTLRDLMAEEMKRDDLSLSEKRLKQKMYERQEADVYSEFIRQFKH